MSRGDVLPDRSEGAEAAVPPVLHGVDHEDRHPTATFGPLPGVDDATIYMASAPARASDGRFLEENVVDLDFLTAGEIQAGAWLYETRLEPATYHLMVRAADFDCFEDPACIHGYSNVLALTIPRPALTISGAKSIARKALRRRFGAAYRFGSFKRIRGCRLLSRSRATCRRVSWSIGDLAYTGHVTVRQLESAGWKATGRIRRTNEYCVVTGGRRCSRTHRLRERAAT